MEKRTSQKAKEQYENRWGEALEIIKKSKILGASCISESPCFRSTSVATPVEISLLVNINANNALTHSIFD